MLNKLFLIVILSFLLLACESKKKVSLARYIDMVKNRSQAEAYPAQYIEKLERYTYKKKQNNNNPFFPESGKLNDRNNGINKQHLIFLGVIKNNKKKWALMNTSDGKLSAVKIGDFLGRNKGKIVDINEDALFLEAITQVQGQQKKVRIELKLGASIA